MDWNASLSWILPAASWLGVGLLPRAFIGYAH
jgi:hypothetical protein